MIAFKLAKLKEQRKINRLKMRRIEDRIELLRNELENGDE